MEKDELSLILRNFIDADGRLASYPSKRKMKGFALLWLAGKFERGRTYTEKEVNRILNEN